ncbi:MAG: hypothetical protein ACRCX8_10255 [Sarcina sp.]
MKTIIMVLVLIASASMLLNVLLINTVVQLKQQRKATKKEAKSMFKVLIKTACSEHKRGGKLEQKIKALEYQIDIASDLLEQYKQIAVKSKKDYEKVLNNYFTVSQTLCDFIRDGKVIKTKYMDNLIMYDFNSLTKQEAEEFFGQQIM